MYWTLLGTLLGGMLSCTSSSSSLPQTTQQPNLSHETLDSKLTAENSTITINNKTYQFSGNSVTELTHDADTEARYGVISDAHGEVERARYFAQLFKQQGVDGIIMPGDIVKNEQLRYGRADAQNDTVELISVLSAVAETGLPVFVIPGNHETKPVYEAALHSLTQKFPNLIDMTRYRIFDGDDVDFVSLPGYQTFSSAGHQFIPENGYWAKPDYIKQLAELRQRLKGNDAIVLVTHAAGKTNAVQGPATMYSGEDVGDELTTTIQQQNTISFAVVGHIHEAGGRAATFNGTPVQPGQWASQFTANFGTLETWQYLNGSVYNGMAGILRLNGTQARYEIFVRNYKARHK